MLPRLLKHNDQLISAAATFLVRNQDGTTDPPSPDAGINFKLYYLALSNFCLIQNNNDKDRPPRWST